MAQRNVAWQPAQRPSPSRVPAVEAALGMTRPSNKPKCSSVPRPRCAQNANAVGIVDQQAGAGVIGQRGAIIGQRRDRAANRKHAVGHHQRALAGPEMLAQIVGQIAGVAVAETEHRPTALRRRLEHAVMGMLVDETRRRSRSRRREAGCCCPHSRRENRTRLPQPKNSAARRSTERVGGVLPKPARLVALWMP